MSKNKIRNVGIIGIIFVVLFIIIGYLWQQNESGKSSTELIKVRYASVPAIVEAPAHIAYHNNYFAEEGLDLSIEMNPDGKTSLEHLFDGQIDIASVMGTPLVYQSFERDDFYILGKIDHNKIHSAIARSDSGIESAEMIKGKHVAVMQGTSGHFFMDSWLIYHGLKPDDVEIYNMNAPDSVEAISRGEVDAMFF